MTQEVVIAAAGRTAIGRFGGTLAAMAAPQLGAHVIRALLTAHGIEPKQVDEVIMGQVLTGGSGQNPARQASIGAGLPDGVPAMTINKVCGSGLKAVMLAAQAGALGDAELIVAGGQEDMSAAPQGLRRARQGRRVGSREGRDRRSQRGL